MLDLEIKEVHQLDSFLIYFCPYPQFINVSYSAWEHSEELTTENSQVEFVVHKFKCCIKKNMFCFSSSIRIKECDLSFAQGPKSSGSVAFKMDFFK